MGEAAVNSGEGPLLRFKESLEGELERAISLSALVPAQDAAVRHMLFPGGKRIRPMLALAFCYDLGGDWTGLVSAAAALEFLHTSSLIHDDLPSMDDDSVRRGKPTCHVAFGEATAVLAGDVLVAMAFRAISANENLDFKSIAACTKSLSETYISLCNGQQLDISEHTKDDLKRIHSLKTGALFGAAFQFGAIGAGLEQHGQELAFKLGSLVGLSFQIIDDLIDDRSQKKGRPNSSDRRNNRTTFGEDQKNTNVDKDELRETLFMVQKEIRCLFSEIAALFSEEERTQFTLSNQMVSEIYRQL